MRLKRFEEVLEDTISELHWLKLEKLEYYLKKIENCRNFKYLGSSKIEKFNKAVKEKFSQAFREAEFTEADFTKEHLAELMEGIEDN